MERQQARDLSVGMFVLVGIFAGLWLVFKASGWSWCWHPTYEVQARFMNIGGLKPHAPVTIAGVKVGEVSAITLMPKALNAMVTLRLRSDVQIPYEDVSLRILTEGLLGSNYISIVPGFDEAGSDHPYLRDGDVIGKTQEAMILENLIGQLLFSIQK